MKLKAAIPSLFTMGNMIMGFISIIYSAQYSPTLGNVSTLYIAGILIFVASIFDLCDGAVARSLGVESEIGMQLDSLADAIAYGIAPGVLAYQAYFYQFPEVFSGFNSGIVVAVVFPVCAIFRLARFNCQDSSGSGFTGLPSPPAGLIVSTVPALFSVTDTIFGELQFVMPLYFYAGFYVVVALLMVSEIDYSKVFSNIWKKGLYARVITLTVIIALLVLFGSWAIFGVTFLYVLWGITRHLMTFGK